MYGRATAVSKSDFASFTFAVRAPSKPWRAPRKARWSCTSPTTKNLVASWARAGC